MIELALSSMLSLGRVLLIPVLVLVASPAWAEKAQFGYNLELSGSLPLLQTGGSSVSGNFLPGDLVNKLNNPWMKLTNTSENATLDRFVMSVGDENFRFSSFTIGSQTGVFDINVNIIDGGKNLELVFANFNPGEAIYVRFQLRPNDPNAFQFPDFQQVLFDLNGNSSDDNALLTAVFHDPVKKQDDTLSGRLPDFASGAATSLYSGCPSCMCFPTGSSTIQAFRFGQENSLEPPVIPEPSSWVLLLLGAVATMFVLRAQSLPARSRDAS